jgi:short-subunit dehydrogenase
VLAVDVFGPLYLIQAVVPQMRARRSGQIINVSSLLALRSLPRVGGYAAAKAAIERLTEALRMEVLDSGIAVTSVRPGTTRTSFFQQRLGRGRERWKPRGVAPETVARTIVRAAQHEPRVAYVTLQDRLQVLGAALVPGLTDRVLARLMLWRDED